MWQTFRPILGLQLLVTAAAIALSGWLHGGHGAASAALGGAIGIVACAAYVALASGGTPQSAGEALYRALRAEAVKIVLMLVLLLGAFAIYRSVVAAALIGTFTASAVLFSLAAFVDKSK